jgi:hypothetical protein
MMHSNTGRHHSFRPKRSRIPAVSESEEGGLQTAGFEIDVLANDNEPAPRSSAWNRTLAELKEARAAVRPRVR